MRGKKVEHKIEDLDLEELLDDNIAQSLVRVELTPPPPQPHTLDSF